MKAHLLSAHLNLGRIGTALALLALSFVLLSSLGTPAGQAAAPQQLAIYTPTPQPDGQIVYIVQEGDSLLSISLVTGVDQETLRTLNNLTGDTLLIGQRIILGRAGPLEVTITPGPTPTATAVLPTPSPKPGAGSLCVLLFEDLNGDSMRQEASEPSLPGGAMNVSSRSGSVSLTAESTRDGEPHCFEKVAEGEYTISVAIPAGFNATTATSFVLPLKAGDVTYVDFGAQRNAANPPPAALTEPTAAGEKSPLLGIVGGLLLVAGIGLAVAASMMLRKG